MKRIYDEIQPIIKLISEAIQSNPNYSNQDFFQSLTDCTDPEDARKAVASLTQEVQRDPTSAEAFFNRGVAYHYLGNRSKSVSDFSKAIQLEPHEPDNYYYRGLIFYQDGSLKDAIEDFSKAIELKPTDEAFYLARCLAYSKFKDDKQAIENCDKVHQLHSQARLSRAPNSLEDIEDDDYILDNAQIIKYIAGERSEASKKQFLESLDHFFVNPIMFRCQLFIDVRCPGGGGSLQVKEGLQQNIKVAKRRKL